MLIGVPPFLGICATYANNLSQEVAQCNQKRHLAEGIHFDISCAAQNLGWILSFFLIFNIIEENPTKEVGKTMSRHAQSQNQRRNMMLNEPISRIIPKMVVPTIVAFLINSVYFSGGYLLRQFSGYQRNSCRQRQRFSGSADHDVQFHAGGSVRNFI